MHELLKTWHTTKIFERDSSNGFQWCDLVVLYPIVMQVNTISFIETKGKRKEYAHFPWCESGVTKIKWCEQCKENKVLYMYERTLFMQVLWKRKLIVFAVMYFSWLLYSIRLGTMPCGNTSKSRLLTTHIRHKVSKFSIFTIGCIPLGACLCLALENTCY